MTPTRERAALLLGRLGLLALAVAFGIVALFLIVAALRHNPNAAKGLGVRCNSLRRSRLSRCCWRPSRSA